MANNKIGLKDIISEELSLEKLVLRELEKLSCNSNNIIRFPTVFGRLGKMFHLSKNESWHVLSQLENCDHIQIIPNNGVKIKSGEDEVMRMKNEEKSMSQGEIIQMDKKLNEAIKLVGKVMLNTDDLEDEQIGRIREAITEGIIQVDLENQKAWWASWVRKEVR